MPLPQLDRNKTGGWVLIAGAVVCSLLFLNEIYGLVQAFRAKAWTPVTGFVLESRAVVGCGKGGSFYPLVRYSYSFDAREYRATRIAFGNVGCGSEHDARRTASAYPPGKKVTVWVNPATPAEATLMVGKVLGESWFGMAILPIFIAGSYLMGRSLLRQSAA